MTFTSLSDLYFVAVGVFAYDVIWSVFVDTKLILVPFGVLFASTIRDAKLKSDSSSDEAYISKRIEKRFALMAITFAIFFLPAHNFNIQDVRQYSRLCDAQAEPILIDQNIDDGGHYRFSGGGGDEMPITSTILEVTGVGQLKMPLGLALIISSGTATSLEVVNRMPCKIDLIGLKADLLDVRITDELLRNEVKLFLKTCYNVANKWANRDPNMPWNQFNEDELVRPWPGHSAFFNENYYGNISRAMYSKVPLLGYQSSNNNQNIMAWLEEDESTAADKWTLEKGFPSCHEWWRGVNSNVEGWTYGDNPESLRTRLKTMLPEYVGETMFGKLSKALLLPSDPLSNSNLVDKLLQLAYFNPISLSELQVDVREYTWLTEENTGTAAIGRGLGTIGNMLDFLPNIAKGSIIQLAAPLFKGGILFVFISTLVFIGIASNFSLTFTLSTHVFIFAVLQWPVLWELTILLQQSYVEAVFEENMLGLFNLDEVNSKMLITYFTDALFVAFPLILTATLAAAGVAIGKEVTNSAQSGGASANTAGGSGARGGKIGNKAGKGAAKGTGKLATKGKKT